jgi:hypothetical protein
MQPLERARGREDDEPAEEADTEDTAPDDAEDDHAGASVDGARARPRTFDAEGVIGVTDDPDLGLERAGQRSGERAGVRLLEEGVPVGLSDLRQRHDLEVERPGRRRRG